MKRLTGPDVLVENFICPSICRLNGSFYLPATLFQSGHLQEKNRHILLEKSLQNTAANHDVFSASSIFRCTISLFVQNITDTGLILCYSFILNYYLPFRKHIIFVKNKLRSDQENELHEKKPYDDFFNGLHRSPKTFFLFLISICNEKKNMYGFS